MKKRTLFRINRHTSDALNQEDSGWHNASRGYNFDAIVLFASALIIGFEFLNRIIIEELCEGLRISITGKTSQHNVVVLSCADYIILESTLVVEERCK